MSIIKIAKDHIIRGLLGKTIVPSGLVELNRYFRQYGPITFKYHNEDGCIVAVSNNFRFGSIVTQGETIEKLEENIKDAILTSFKIPCSYTKEAGIIKQGEEQVDHAYALA